MSAVMRTVGILVVTLALAAPARAGILTAPFQFTGFFSNPSPAGRLDLIGSGEATLNFAPRLSK